MNAKSTLVNWARARGYLNSDGFEGGMPPWVLHFPHGAEHVSIVQWPDPYAVTGGQFWKLYFGDALRWALLVDNGADSLTYLDRMNHKHHVLVASYTTAVFA